MAFRESFMLRVVTRYEYAHISNILSESEFYLQKQTF